MGCWEGCVEEIRPSLEACRILLLALGIHACEVTAQGGVPAH